MNEAKEDTEFLIVGSGPGGAGVARDLARAGRRVTVVEMGPDVPPTGTALGGALRYTGGVLGALSLRAGVLLTKEWLPIVRGITTGGSSMLYLGTAFEPDPEMWKPFGFDLQEEAAARKQELGVGPVPDRFIGAGVHRLMAAAQDLGHEWHKLDKLIDSDQCVESCNVCMYGCHHGAKWHARDWILDAVRHGATWRSEQRCERVERNGHDTTKVHLVGPQGSRSEICAQTVIIAAGGIGSPVILRRSGIDAAGRAFFFDPFVMTTGVFEQSLGRQGVMMSTGMQLRDEGVVITDMQYPALAHAVQGIMAGQPSATWQYGRTMPVMIKIRDDMTGSIDDSARVSKRLTPDDHDKLRLGQEVTTEILHAMGAVDVWHTRIGAAHPGGTCAMGRVVDANMQTEIDGVYVCDASVVPVPFGIPPTLTCLALSKRLADHLLAA